MAQLGEFGYVFGNSNKLEFRVQYNHLDELEKILRSRSIPLKNISRERKKLYLQCFSFNLREYLLSNHYNIPETEVNNKQSDTYEFLVNKKFNIKVRSNTEIEEIIITVNNILGSDTEFRKLYLLLQDYLWYTPDYELFIQVYEMRNHRRGRNNRVTQKPTLRFFTKTLDTTQNPQSIFDILSKKYPIELNPENNRNNKWTLTYIDNSGVRITITIEQTSDDNTHIIIKGEAYDDDSIKKSVNDIELYLIDNLILQGGSHKQSYKQSYKRSHKTRTHRKKSYHKTKSRRSRK